MANTEYTVQQAIERGNIIISHHPSYSMDRRGYGLNESFYDCSSFIGSCWGISSVPATPFMVRVYKSHGFDHYKYKDIGKKGLRRGDILVYNGPSGGAGPDGHTAMYIGDDKTMEARGGDWGIGIFTFRVNVHKSVWQDVLRGTDGIYITKFECTSHPDKSFG